MDVEATLRDLLTALEDRDWDRIDELTEALLQWMERGGLPKRRDREPDLAVVFSGERSSDGHSASRLQQASSNGHAGTARQRCCASTNLVGNKVEAFAG